ncbi:MAG: hypothetical protein ACRDJC_10135 [Thermomicrobiales bacterium]
MNRTRYVDVRIRAAPWIVAGALLVGGTASATAQDATPAPIEAGATAEEAPAALPAGSSDDVGAGTQPTSVPSTGVGPGLSAGGTGPLGVGALVGAAIAAGAALRERHRARA